MILESLKLTSYRNIDKLDIEFDEKLNIIYGLNGQGKTNIVEAIDFISSLKSFRNDTLDSLIELNNDFSVIEAKFKEMSIKHHVRIVLSSKGAKIEFDKNELKRLGDFIGVFNVVTFSPSDVMLFKDSPKRRREFMNDEISKMSPSYYYLLSSYQKILKERNEMLKMDNKDKILFEVVTKQYAELCLQIMKKRYQFVNSIQSILGIKFKEISKLDKDISLKYETFLEESELKFENVLEKILEKSEEDEKYRATQVGIHRDDLIFLMDENPIASFGSQGQMRLCVIATKLALIDLSYNQTGSRSIVIFDDVFSELDKIRQKQILDSVPKENQVFITTAQTKEQIRNLIENGLMFKVTSGLLETEE